MAKLDKASQQDAELTQGVNPVVAAISPEIQQLGRAIKDEGQANRDHSEKMASLSVHAMRLDVNASMPHAEQAIREAAQSSEAVISAATSALMGQSAAVGKEIASAISGASQSQISADMQMVQALAAAIMKRSGFRMKINRDSAGLMDSVDVVPM